MNDRKMIERMAELWIEMGGDGDGIRYLWRDIAARVDELTEKVDA